MTIIVVSTGGNIMVPFTGGEALLNEKTEDQETWALETLDNVLSTPAQRTEARVILGTSWEEALELEGSELLDALELEEVAF